VILAIDIGGTFIKFGLVDDNFNITNQSKVPTPASIDDFWLKSQLQRQLTTFGGF